MMLRVRIVFNIPLQDTGRGGGCHLAEAVAIRLPTWKGVGTMCKKKGYGGTARATIVSTVTADRNFWVDTMMTEELGLAVAPTVSPWRSGAVVAAAYALGAAFPVVPYALPVGISSAFGLSSALTLCALFVAGAAKTRMTGRKWHQSGLESAMVGAIAASATYLAGHLLAGAD